MWQRALLYRNCSWALGKRGPGEGLCRKRQRRSRSRRRAMEMDMNSGGGPKKRHWEIDRDKRKEIIERTLHYCWSSSPLESVYLLSRQEICYWRTGGGTMRWIPLKSTTPLMSQHVRNHHLFNYLVHLYLRFYLWLSPPIYSMFICCCVFWVREKLSLVFSN